jgi:hypothetical protein
MTITSTPNEIKSHKDPPLAGADGVVAAAAGALTGSEGVLAPAAGVGVASAAGVLTGSEDELAVTAGAVVVAAGVADRLRECAGSRFG